MQNEQTTFMQRRKIGWLLIGAVFLFCVLIVRVAWLQIVRGEELSLAAREQQTSDNLITPKRGLIYDRNMKILANNISVETISISPKNVRGNTKQTQEQIAGKMADILGLEKDAVLAKIQKESSFEYIKKKVEKDQADELREYIETYNLDGIKFTEDSKRYYPYGNFASQVIGFAGSDNVGLEGIEMVYNEQLQGVPGRIVSANKTAGLEMPDNYESYYEPQDGNSVVLTIDETMQHIAEKHLENARIENQLEEGAATIIMDVKTGEILAMATKPDYNLNSPFEITEAVEEKYPEVREELEKLEDSEYNAALTKYTQFLRRNKAVVDSYEPGSTFKIAVASMALEENAISPNDTFYCDGSAHVADRTISCANRNGHGVQTFVQAVQNSCNPAFINIGTKVGRERFMKYMKGFGFRDTTGIELPGETNGIFHDASNFKEIDLAISSFGQSFNVTPLQIVTMVSAIANGGELMQPHLVKQLVDKNGNVVQEFAPKVVRRVVSKETSAQMCEILESVVSVGGGKNAYLAGYRIAGKTGTSEKQPRGNQKYVASFIGFAPADDPEIVCLVILDQPPVGAPYYGGVIAAPVVKNILEECLQYLGVEPQYSEDETEMMDITVPDITGKTKEEAEKILAELNLNITVKGSGNIIFDQVPKPFSKLARKSKIVAYTEGVESSLSVEVPNVVGLSATEANRALTDAGLNVRIKGLSSGAGVAMCSGQSPGDGTKVEPGTIITIDFAYSGVRD